METFKYGSVSGPGGSSPGRLARYVGQVQSLITTCVLHGIDPYTYLVDVLQRISIHPQAQLPELTPRLWKQHFAETPLGSWIDS
jgi:hypothetical protein